MNYLSFENSMYFIFNYYETNELNIYDGILKIEKNDLFLEN